MTNTEKNTQLTLKQKRDLAFEYLAEVNEVIWGERCPDVEAGCACCAAWAVYDCIEKLTDSSYLEDTDLPSDKTS